MKQGTYTYISQQIFDDLGLARHGGRLDGIAEQLILFRQSNRFLPAFVLAVDLSCDLSEEHEVVFFESLGELHSIVIVVVLHRVFERLVVLFFDEQIMDRAINYALVLTLDIE